MKRSREATSVALIGGCAMLAACGGGSPAAPAAITVHGTFDRTFASGNCDYAGQQVQITSPSGTVIGTATLPLRPTARIVTLSSGDKISVDQYPYSAIVPVEPRYGVTVDGMKPYYASRADFLKGLDLSC